MDNSVKDDPDKARKDRRKPAPSMCDSVRSASLKCTEMFGKKDCQAFFDAASKCRSIKTKLEDEEYKIKKYLNDDDITDQQKQSLNARLIDIKIEKSTPYPVPKVQMPNPFL
ncbi:hypothetical protein DLAC_03774 [Tieghemostelium lacteum]|uniref:Uncharacterized protein n=1 Tax=Tieghemostelium lacteum TaxID=361077 RepID=A0A152A0P1_TIELA|nr:hypothetical protein DLAC_03774 [Tieghemostelium lacteum]|eukprot:KYQ99822.1 hypothetical protein DLAC_03774 [Tieghemostelium lacteum]